MQFSRIITALSVAAAAIALPSVELVRRNEGYGGDSDPESGECSNYGTPQCCDQVSSSGTTSLADVLLGVAGLPIATGCTLDITACEKTVCCYSSTVNNVDPDNNANNNGPLSILDGANIASNDNVNIKLFDCQ